MAFPVIRVDSTNGAAADIASISGAGPTTSVNGTAAATDIAGTTVTVDAGKDISGIATDGSAALILNDVTAGHRRWSKIIGSAGSGGATPTFTVNEAYTGSLSGLSWGVGGVRATIANSVSQLLFSNNSAAGDAMPGWTVEMQSGHSEVVSANLDFRRAGDTTSGPITLRGASGAATRPLLTFSNNGNSITSRGAYQTFRDFEMRNSNATKTASVAFANGAASAIAIINVKVAHSTDKYWKYITDGGSGYVLVRDCEFGYAANIGIDITVNKHSRYLFNSIHDGGSIAVSMTAVAGNLFLFYGNLVYNNAGDGLKGTSGSSSAQSYTIAHNTFYNNTGDGIEFSQTSNNLFGLTIVNNIFANNGGYGLNISAAADIDLVTGSSLILNNNFFTNTSGTHNPATMTASENETTADPQFTSTSVADFSIGTNLKKTGYPLGGTLRIGSMSAGTFSYPDPGAAQRDEDAVFGYLPVAP
jgi:hypothetical protein